MKIAITSFYLPPVDKIGVGYQSHYFAQALVSRGHEVTMISPRPKPENAVYEHLQVNAGNSFRLHQFAWAIRDLDLQEFDVLHSYGECQWRWLSSAVKRPKRHVRTILGSCLEEAFHIKGIKNRIRMLYIAATETLACATSDVTVAISENTRRFYPWIQYVIPSAVDLTAFAPGTKTAIPTILFVGTYANRKRGKWLMEVFRSKIKTRIPEARLWMVCSDVPKQEITEGIEVLGRLSLAELTERYGAASVFCLPSTYEGFGVPYIEAMASGLPVVATPNPGSVEVTRKGQDGLVVPDEELGDTLVRVLTDPELAQKLANAGLKRSKDFSWETVCSRYEKLYHLDSR
jgi:phosphatidylinositol alpha-mannosyltransferase